MQLSEKEIEGCIWDHVRPDGIGLADTVHKAAHAIAEKLAEGVAWTSERGHFRIQHLVEPDETCIDGDMDLEDIVMPGHIGEDGERVTVTVTKEEGDGQGVD